MKNIIIFGPIGDFGGRDIEVNIIANALEQKFNITIISTEYITKNSFALNDLKNTKYTSLNKELFKNNIGFKFSSLLSYFKNYCNKEVTAYVNNSFSKKYLCYNHKRLEILHELFSTADLVIMPMQLSSNLLKEAVEFAHSNNIPTILRTTGTIFQVPIHLEEVLKKVSIYLHHSELNANNLSKFVTHSYKIIDQCASSEENLLQIPIMKRKPLRYGFLGRLSSEKQIEQLTQFFINSNLPFLIAGDGPLKEVILKKINNKDNCKYLGLIKNSKIKEFFNEIDVLIISSTEETGPLVGLEAMAAGKLIITTEVGAMPERLKFKESNFLDRNLSNLGVLINELENTNIINLKIQSNQYREYYLKKYSKIIIQSKYLTLINHYF